MRILNWIRSRFEMAPINRVASVTCDEHTINMKWMGGSTASLKLDDVQRVLIHTTDRGPFDDDVFLVMVTAEMNFVIAQSAPGAGGLLGRLQELPEFDNGAVIDSMGCTDNHEFLCWERRSE